VIWAVGKKKGMLGRGRRGREGEWREGQLGWERGVGRERAYRMGEPRGVGEGWRGDGVLGRSR